MSDWREQIAGRTVVASVSGGKDSAAMCLWLKEQGIEHRRVFADTGWEHPDTYDYLRGPLTKALGPIVEVKSEVGGMVEWVRKKGMFPSRQRRFCTEELKVRPLAAYMVPLAPVVNATGIRAEESQRRALQPEWEPAADVFGADALVWRPIIRWTHADVVEIHRRHGLAPNPLYLRGASRVGCWPCIFSRKGEIRLVAESTPERVDLMELMEAEVESSARARASALGTTLERDGLALRAWFQARKGRGGECWPIRRVVEWARNGSTLELFDDPQGGCARWGLCEAPPSSEHGGATREES